ncbi:gp53-like domain-containing protein [Pseudomonas sp. OV221]|uniref:gp53-like domain-containing protein n=1 Tax=Pseudomonas zeae TaxID=2745510 RepID=UPI000E243925
MDYPKNIPSAGLVNGRFVDENPLTGTPGSLIPASWGNAVTQEILEVIKVSGAAADESDNTQLKAAIDTLIARKQSESLAGQDEAESGTSNTRLMTPLRVFQAIAKKVQQATESLVGTAKIASQAEVNAGVSDTSIVTPKKLRLGFMVRLGPSGYVVFPSWMGGVIIQWISGSASQAGNSNYGDVNPWPLMFPNALFLAVATHEGTSSATLLVWNNATISRLAGINVRCPDYPTGSIAARVIGIGY